MLPLNEVLSRFFAFCEIFVKLLTEVNELTTIYCREKFKHNNTWKLSSTTQTIRVRLRL